MDLLPFPVAVIWFRSDYEGSSAPVKLDSVVFVLFKSWALLIAHTCGQSLYQLQYVQKLGLEMKFWFRDVFGLDVRTPSPV